MKKALKNFDIEVHEFLRKSINGHPVYPFGSGWKDAEGHYYYETIDGIIPEEWNIPAQSYKQITTTTKKRS